MRPALIPVPSERQAMDWGLVLASQDIPTVIQRVEGEAWALVVDVDDRARALRAIKQYHVENRRWKWPPVVTISKVDFDWSALAWCGWLVLAYWISTARFPGLGASAVMDSQAVWAGQIWRLFTAVWLHGDLAHLLSNVTTGFVLLGLAFARHGSGLTLLAGWICGVLGNVAGLLIYLEPYTGLGASGMVMGALGLLAAPSWQTWKQGTAALKLLVRGTLAGALLFVLLGMNPASDVIAHGGGFLAGYLLGTGAASIPEEVKSSKKLQGWCWFGLALLIVATTWLSLNQKEAVFIE